MIKIKTTVEVETNINSVTINAKVRDLGSYDFKDDTGKIIKSLDNEYVPDFFPGQHYGDYLELEIDIETGVILNWVKPTSNEIEKILNKSEDDED